jgi:hypothetical protein
MSVHRIALSILAVLSLPSWANALDHFSHVAQDQNGRAVSGATVTVYQAGTTTLAALYADNGVTLKANPFTTAIDGVYDFYAASARYDITIRKTGYTAIYWDANKMKGLTLFDPEQHVVPYGGTLPAAPETGALFVLLNDGGSCLNDSGTATTLCRWSGSGWGPLGGASGSGLDQNFDIANEIDGATSARPLIVGNGTQKGKLYGDATKGFVVEPVPLGDSLWRVWTNFNGCVYDEESAALVFCYDPDAAQPRDKYLFKAGYYPLKSFYLPAGYWDGDGTQCPASPSVVTINSGPKLPTFVCADNSAATLHATAILPPDYASGTTLKIRQHIIQTAADTGSVLGDVSAQCRGNSETPSSTWGTAVALDLTNASGSNAHNWFEAAGITPAGTCVAGDLLSIRYVFDAASTTASSTLHFVGFDIFYSSESLSH